MREFFKLIKPGCRQMPGWSVLPHSHLLGIEEETFAVLIHLFLFLFYHITSIVGNGSKKGKLETKRPPQVPRLKWWQWRWGEENWLKIYFGDIIHRITGGLHVPDFKDCTLGQTAVECVRKPSQLRDIKHYGSLASTPTLPRRGHLEESV